MPTRFLTAVLFGILTVGQARAEVQSGPKEGEKIAALKVFAVVGEPKGKEVDFAGLRKDQPTVYLFVSAKDFGRPMFRYMKKLNDSVGEDALVVAVWLTEDTDKLKEYLPKVADYFTGASLAVFGELAGPNDWGISPDAHLTAVVANQGKVVKSFAYQSLNETDVPAVMEVLKKALKK